MANSKKQNGVVYSIGISVEDELYLTLITNLATKDGITCYVEGHDDGRSWLILEECGDDFELYKFVDKVQQILYAADVPFKVEVYCCTNGMYLSLYLLLGDEQDSIKDIWRNMAAI